MKVTFLGATHEVTGSCTLIECGNNRGLVDCGMEQGKDIFENQKLPVAAGEIDFVLLTHAHIDHSGNLPLLFKNGFDGPIYATRETCNLCRIMLRDCAHIQESEAEWRNRKSRRSGGPAYEPVYTLDDAEAAIAHLRPVSYHELVQVGEHFAVRFSDVCHLLGSACIEVFMTENGVERKMVFSGDIGNLNQPIIRNVPETVADADYVMIESTYGDRLHDRHVPPVKLLADYIQRTLDRGGNLVIPSFAVGRTQEMLYFIREIKAEHLVHGHGEFPVYVDSPLAVEATNIFRDHQKECYDSDAAALLAQGINPILFPGLKLSITSDESKAINFNETPKVIISASGMCDAGRIKHHLKHNVWRPGASIVFVGYQGVGTPGRSLVEGCKKITLFGEDMEVRAKIYSINSFSAHAGQTQLLDWLSPLAASKPQVVIVHGEEKAQQILSGLIKQRFGLETIIPAYLEEMTISGKTVEADQTHAELAQPKIDWQFLSDEVLRKWDLFQKKIANVNERPWVEQKSIEKALMKMEYYLTRLISKI